MKWKLQLPLYHATMRTKLILTYTLGIVLPLIILGTLFIGSAGTMIETQLIGMAGASISQMAEQLNAEFESYSKLTDQYEYDRLFVQALRKSYPGAIDAMDFYEDIWQRQRSYLQAWPYVRNITVYTENPTLVSTEPFLLRTDEGYIAEKDFDLVQKAGSKGMWSPVKKVDKRYEYWNPKNTGTSGSFFTFTYSRSFKSERSALGASAMVAVEIYDDAILQTLSSGMNGMENFIVDERGTLVSGGKLPAYLSAAMPGKSQNKPEGLRYNDKDYLLWNTALSNGWHLMSSVSLDIVTEQAQRMRMAALGILTAMALLAMLAIGLMSDALTKRIRLLVEKMHSVNGSTQHLKPIGGNDEINVIDRAFTAMTGRLRDSMEKQYSAEVRRTEAELELLHTQINPHFLYNSLSAIAWLADSHPPGYVRSAIENLASYYRLTLAKGREIITLKEELDGLDAYIRLQRLRYDSGIHYLIEIDEALLNVFIPRLTLQPLVENSITHGVGDERRPISVIISAQVHGDTLRLIVTDDGVGMDADRQAQLERGEVSSGTGSGLGYRNVSERIRLHFGDSFGLHVHSEQGRGTTVEVLLPISGA